MVTRHLYETSAVAAQFIHSIINREFLIAAQCARELSISDMNELLFRLLTFVWILSDPINIYEKRLYNMFQTHNIDGFLCVLFEYAPISILPDIQKTPGIFCTPPAPPAHLTLSPPESWTKRPIGWTPTQCALLWRTIQTALAKKQSDRAYRLCAQLIDNNKLSLENLMVALGLNVCFTEILATSVYTPFTHRILKHAFAILVTDENQSVCINGCIKTGVEAWRSKKNIGGCLGRLFSISPDAIHAWHVRPKPFERLCGSPTLIARDDACVYWENICKKYGVTVSENNELCIETNEEEFYKTCFPNDIPDEWSESEKKKSHGMEIQNTISEKNPWQVSFLLCWS